MRVGNASSAGSNTNCQVPLYLNVYDLTPINGYVYWIGLGIFHSGIEAHGAEYAFGAHDYPSSGVFEVEPRRCPGFTFRSSVPLGTTDLSPLEFRSFIEQCADEYYGDTYHLIAKNCNHFTDDLCQRLTGKSIPGWVNRLARIGYACNCLLPEGLQVSVMDTTDQFRHGEEHEFGEGTEMVESESDQDSTLLTLPNSDTQTLLRDSFKEIVGKPQKDEHFWECLSLSHCLTSWLHPNWVPAPWPQARWVWCHSSFISQKHFIIGNQECTLFYV